MVGNHCWTNSVCAHGGCGGDSSDSDADKRCGILKQDKDLF